MWIKVHDFKTLTKQPSSKRKNFYFNSQTSLLSCKCVKDLVTQNFTTKKEK